MEIFVQRRHAIMVEDGAVSHKIDYVTILEILNIKGHQNRITGSRVTAILLNGWILPIYGASVLEGLLSMGLPCLVSLTTVLKRKVCSMVKLYKLVFLTIKILNILRILVFLLLYTTRSILNVSFSECPFFRLVNLYPDITAITLVDGF